jgi:hypothetical protein
MTELDHQPVLAVVGQQARAGLGGSYQQEVDLHTLFKDIAHEFVETAATVPCPPSGYGQDMMRAAGEPVGGRPAREIAHGGMRGTIAAMAMSGMRALTVDIGLVEQPPPDAIFMQKAPGLLRRIPVERQRAAIELAHWTYGTGGGVAFALLPSGARRRAWAGPAYGLLLWVGFEAGLAPLLGVAQAHKPRAAERAALAVDHLLYGLVLSELRRRPQA